MVDTTNIEKKSLEAHVELCAERYNAMEAKLDDVNAKINRLDAVVCEVRDLVQKMNSRRNEQIMTWGLSTISVHCWPSLDIFL
jgi:uncharacterized protein YoxC